MSKNRHYDAIRYEAIHGELPDGYAYDDETGELLEADDAPEFSLFAPTPDVDDDGDEPAPEPKPDDGLQPAPCTLCGELVCPHHVDCQYGMPCQAPGKYQIGHRRLCEAHARSVWASLPEDVRADHIAGQNVDPTLPVEVAPDEDIRPAELPRGAYWSKRLDRYLKPGDPDWSPDAYEAITGEVWEEA